VDVAEGAAAATGPAFLTTTFTIAKPGDPLPNLVDVVVADPGPYAPSSVDFRSTTIGRVPNGRRALLQVEQIGSYDTDWTWSVEKVEIVVPRK
jgi:hypothetical protein